MDKQHISEDDVFLWACGELEPERREQVGKAIEADAALAEKARQFTETLNFLGQAEKAMTSDDFNTTLRAKLEADLRNESTAHPKLHRLTARRFAWAAAAAMIVLALAVFGVFGGRKGSIAWAEVLEAMGAVRNLHVTVLHSDDGEESHIDFYYRHPDTWRVHSRETVQFATGDQMRVYDARTRQFVDDLSTVRRRIVPLRQLQFIGNDNLLESMLRTFFRDQVPKGEPVMSTPEALAPDIALFDYANDPERLWIRVWVLRESRLPIRVEMYNPKADNYSLLLFNYSDPQPDSFFDADAFAKEVKEKHLDKPYLIYRAGSRPLGGGKPVNRREIQDIEKRDETTIGQVEMLNEEFGVKAPTLLEIEADKNGDLLLVVRDPANAKAKDGYDFKEQGYWAGGYHITGYYDRFLWDTWGNAYVRTEAFALKHGGGCRIHMTYAPIPPFKEGVGKHTLIVTYSLEDRQTWGSQLISRTAVYIPASSAKHDPSHQWGGDQVKERALRPFTRTATTVLEEFDRSEAALAKDPTSVPLVLQMIDKLRGRGREDAAWKLFEDRIKDRVIADAFKDYRLSRALGSYLFYLLDQDRIPEIEAVIAQLEDAKKETFKTMNPKEVERVKTKIEDSRSGHYVAVHIPESVRELKAGPKPRIASIIRSRDGYVYVEFDQLGEKSPGDADYKWSKQNIQIDETCGYTLETRRNVKDRLFIVAKGKGDNLTVVFHPVLFIHPKSSCIPRIAWPLTFKVPEATEATVEDMLRDHCPDMRWPGPDLSRFMTPFLQATKDADALYRDARYEMAMARYQETAEMPLSDMLVKGQTTLRRGPITEYSNRRWVRLGMVRCLIKLGRLDDAQSLLDELEEERLNMNLKASEEGLERMRRWNWHASDEVYWMLRDAREESSAGP